MIPGHTRDFLSPLFLGIPSVLMVHLKGNLFVLYVYKNTATRLSCYLVGH